MSSLNRVEFQEAEDIPIEELNLRKAAILEHSHLEADLFFDVLDRRLNLKLIFDETGLTERKRANVSYAEKDVILHELLNRVRGLNNPSSPAEDRTSVQPTE
jgi:hypothetical protein